MNERERRKRLVMRRYMGLMYLGGLVLWIVVGAKHAMPRWVVAIAATFCVTRIWMVMRPAPAEAPRDSSGKP